MRTLRLLVLLALAGCGGGTDPAPTDTGGAPDPDAPEQVTLYSIDPSREAKPESFRGWPVLGKVEIKTPAQRKELVAALKDGIARRPDGYAKCFEPRHGLRVVDKGKTIDYVICFSCSNYTQDGDDGHVGLAPINSDVRPNFDKPLKDAGVPLAP